MYIIICDLNHTMKNNICAYLSKEEHGKIKKIQFTKGNIIFREGQSCNALYLVLKGNIKIASYTLMGNEVVYNIVNEGEMFGNNLIFSSSNLFRGNVIAASNGTLGEIKKDDLLQLLQSNLKFLSSFLEYESDFGKELNLKVKLLSIQSAEERFLYFLQINHNSITYSSITNLASSLFLQRETLSRLISKLIKNKTISKSNKTIVSHN